MQNTHIPKALLLDEPWLANIQAIRKRIVILDLLATAEKYRHLAPRLAGGFDFLTRSDLSQLPDGRHSIDGDELFAVVAREMGRGRASAPLEFHRRYVDIQYVASGHEVIGWRPCPTCKQPRGDYNEHNDIGFYSDPPATWLDLQPGTFAVFFPHDAHAPLAGEGAVHKVVVKVAIDIE